MLIRYSSLANTVTSQHDYCIAGFLCEDFNIVYTLRNIKGRVTCKNCFFNLFLKWLI